MLPYNNPYEGDGIRIRRTRYKDKGNAQKLPELHDHERVVGDRVTRAVVPETDGPGMGQDIAGLTNHAVTAHNVCAWPSIGTDTVTESRVDKQGDENILESFHGEAKVIMANHKTWFERI